MTHFINTLLALILISLHLIGGSLILTLFNRAQPGSIFTAIFLTGMFLMLDFSVITTLLRKPQP